MFDTSAGCGHNDHMARNVVGARELKTRLGTYLQRVREGRTLVVTDRGEPVAELRPLPFDDSLPSALLKLSTKGTVTLPTRDGLPAFRPIRSRGASVADAVGEDREDRF
jgi:prevent-host-death family protein